MDIKKFKKISDIYDGPFKDVRVGSRKVVRKGWGGLRDDLIGLKPIGEVFVYHNNGRDFDKSLRIETVKLLYIEENKKLSHHFHCKKDELFFLVSGEIILTLIADGVTENFLMEEGDCARIFKGMVHSMEGRGKKNILLEVSSLDRLEDSYRIKKGD